MGTTENKKSCFVVMGFGIKTDYATGRKLNLDKSYRLLIKPVVEQKGLICIRADEIRHSGSIDVPMYQQLLQADVVVADLSTANLNAFYELGIRHALRPRTTIVISEDQLPYPFDLNHISISKYTHLGDAIDYDEVMRFQKVLGETIDAVLNVPQPDSPVYTFLDGLVPPSLQQKAAEVATQIKESLENNTVGLAAPTQQEEESKTLSLLVEQGEQAIKNKDFAAAKSLFSSALLIGKGTGEVNVSGNNAYLIQRLALCIYKAQPENASALHEGLKTLDQLDIENTNDPETLALAGAIEKKLFEIGEGELHINDAIQYYERGYYLRNDRYNGINLAFMLNCRAASRLDAVPEEQIADMINASRLRKEIIALSIKLLQDIAERESKANARALLLVDNEISSNQAANQNEQKFWTLANLAEAYFGIGKFDEYKDARTQAVAVDHQDWMLESLDNQVLKLNELMKQTGHLLNPKWVEPSTLL